MCVIICAYITLLLGNSGYIVLSNAFGFIEIALQSKYFALTGFLESTKQIILDVIQNVLTRSLIL